MGVCCGRRLGKSLLRSWCSPGVPLLLSVAVRVESLPRFSGLNRLNSVALQSPSIFKLTVRLAYIAHHAVIVLDMSDSQGSRWGERRMRCSSSAKWNSGKWVKVEGYGHVCGTLGRLAFVAIKCAEERFRPVDFLAQFLDQYLKKKMGVVMAFTQPVMMKWPNVLFVLQLVGFYDFLEMAKIHPFFCDFDERFEFFGNFGLTIST